jgi:hypothetical protein
VPEAVLPHGADRDAGPVVDPLAVRSLPAGDASPCLSGQRGDQVVHADLRLAGGGHGVVDLGGQNMGDAAFLQPGPQVLDLPVCLVRGDPCERNLCVDRALEHPLEVFVLGREGDGVVDPGPPTARAVVGPGLREVQLAVDQRAAFGGGVGQKGPDLAILRSAGGAGVLALNAGRAGALLQEAGVVADQDAVLGTDGLHHVGAHVVADGVLVPVGVVQQALDTVRTYLADLLGQRPAVFPLQRSQEPGQVVQCPVAGLRPAETVGEPGMQPGYPLGPRLDLLDRQLISTQSHQRDQTPTVTADAVAVLT